jgi:DNA-binding LytR/AlgR family response regulator
MNINCIAIDDEPIALEIIKSLSEKVNFINLKCTFTQTSVANKYLRKFPVDLIFLDIQMPDINGIDFYKSLKQEVMVIFTTAHSEFAIEGFNVSAIDFILKPIEIERFKQACSKAKDYFDYLRGSAAEKQKCLYVRSEYSLVKVPVSNILYIETLDDHIKIHTLDNHSIITLMSMKKIMEKLSPSDFIRVHRSFIVSLSNIKAVRNKSILIGSVEIPIGTSFEQDFYNIYKE